MRLYILVLLIPLTAYVYHYGIKVLQRGEVYFTYTGGFITPLQKRHIQGKQARLFAYSSIVGGFLISLSFIVLAFANEPAYWSSGIAYLTLCPTGLLISVFGTLISFLLSNDSLS